MIDDRELVELLRNDPELLAIADAVEQTQRGLRPRRSQRRAGAVLGLAACLAVVAAAGAFVLRPSATAGIPGGAYVHVTLERMVPETWLVNLRTGEWRQSTVEDELWIRDDGGVIDAVRHFQGKVVETGRYTPTRGTSSAGPVKLSPNLDSTAGVQPLAAVYGGAVDALEHGGRIVAGPRTIFGHRVGWIGFGRASRMSAVALDLKSGTPVAVREQPAATAIRVLTYHQAAVPALPKVEGRQESGLSDSTDVAEVTPARAAASVPGAVWAGSRVGQLPLRRLLQQRLTQQGEPGSRPGLAVRYGQAPEVPDPLAPYLYISQALTPEAAYRFSGVSPAPPDGFMQVTSVAPEARTKQLTALVRTHGVYLWIQTNLPGRQLRAIVRGLRPLG